MAGRGEGFPHLEGPSGAWRIGGSMPSISPAQSGPRKPAGFPDWVLYPLRPPPGSMAPRGIGGKQGEKKRGRLGGGPCRIRGSG